MRCPHKAIRRSQASTVGGAEKDKNALRADITVWGGEGEGQNCTHIVRIQRLWRSLKKTITDTACKQNLQRIKARFCLLVTWEASRPTDLYQPDGALTGIRPCV